MSNSVRDLKIERFGDKLKLLRERHKMTYVDLAHALGYGSTSQVYYLETSKRNPTAEVILKLSKLFGVSADVLLDDELELDGETPADEPAGEEGA